MTVDTPTDPGRRSPENDSTPALSSLAVIRAVASAERRRFDHQQLATRRKKAFGILMVAALLPVFGAVLWGAYGLGGSVSEGDGQALLSITRWYLPVSVAFYVLYGANRATNRLLGFDARELLLTTVRERDLVLGLLYADLRESGIGLLEPVPAGERKEVVADVEDSLRDEQFEDGTWIADYRRLRFVAVRTGN